MAWIPQLGLLLASVFVATSAAGCSDDSSPAEDQPDDGPVIALLEEANDWPAAIVSGRLTERQGCLLIENAVAVFPHGTEWTPPSVTFRNGQTVQVDSRIRLGGGWFEVEGVTQESLPMMPVAEVRECARQTGATQYVLAAPDGLH